MTLELSPIINSGVTGLAADATDGYCIYEINFVYIDVPANVQKAVKLFNSI